VGLLPGQGHPRAPLPRPEDAARGRSGRARSGVPTRVEEEEKRYNAEKKDIEKDAKKLEALRDSFQARDPYFLLAEALLQIAIVMSSVSILARSGLIFSFSLILAVVGAALTANGYFTLVHLPFFHGGH
jgi:hypothetical protein